MRRQQSVERRSENGNAGAPAAPQTVTTTSADLGTQKGAPSAPAAQGQASSWAEQIAAWRELLPAASPDGLRDEERLALLRELELLTRAVAALGARVQVAFYTSQVAAQIADGVAPSRAGKAVPDDLAQARLTSPYWGSRELTCAKALVQEMPRTLGALRAGVITALQARVITEATTCVAAADRAEIDERLAPRLVGASTQQIGALARSLVYEVDPAGFVARARKAAADRGVSIRPCPDVMGLLSARLPAPQAIACYHSLRTTAETMKASGDPRTLGQLMADALFERLTGRTVVDGIDVEVGLVITDEALLAGTSDPAVLLGYGPIPAQTARDLLNPTTDTGEADSSDTVADTTDGAAEDDGEDGGSVPTDPGEDGRAAHSDAVDDGEDADTGPGADHAAPDPTDRAGKPSTGAAPGTSLGFVGGIVPAGHCPAGPRCTNFSCTLTHGHPAATGLPAPPDLGSLSHGGEPVNRSLTRPDESDKASPGAGEKSDPQNESAREERRRGAAPDTAPAATVWLRRLYTDPVTGVLTERDNRTRLFTGALRAFLVARDQTCRNSWCGAPVRHLDHVQRHADQGSTDAENGRGLCARCNLARERPRQLDTPPCTYLPPPPLLPCLPRTAHSAAA